MHNPFGIPKKPRSAKVSPGGFTLIELLAVIAIIGLLASMVLASLSSARMNARNVRRAADIKNLINALELYYNDYGSYPSTSMNWMGYATCWPPEASGPDWIPGLAPVYVRKMPRDPLNSELCYEPQYLYRSNGVDYKLLAHVGNPEDCDSVVAKYPELSDPVRVDEGGCWAFGFFSPGAKNW